MTYALLVLSYLLGATPTSYWVGRVFHGVDLREHGSGNLGATNAFRVMGASSAVPVVLVDIAKGFVPAYFFADLAGVGSAWALAYGLAAIVGHIFSIWVGFKGGKGVATSAGVFLAVAPWAVLGSFLVWAALALPTGYVSLGSIGAAASLPFFVALVPHRGGGEVLYVTAGLSLFVLWAHRSNMRRLSAGTENRFGRLPPAAAGDTGGVSADAGEESASAPSPERS